MSFNRQQQAIIDFSRHILRPKPKLTGTEFANEKFQLSPESSSEAGRMTLHPYQEEPINCMTDQHTEFVTFQKSARVGYSISLNITTAYFITQDPCSILFAQPTDDEAYGYATDSIEPMIRDNPDVSTAIGSKPIRGKAKKEKTVKKLYAGGILEIVGAHSPKNFRRRTVRVAVGDEIDGWEIGAGDEGDQIKLMTKRTNDFYNRKVIVGSTPTTLQKSRIVKEYEKGDQRKRHLPCPFCGEYHTLEFENLKYEKDENGEVIDESVGFACPKCGVIYNQSYHKEMDINGKWIAKKPFKGHASFFIWAAYSYSAKSTWVHIAKEYEEAKSDPILMQPFVNTVLGLPYEDNKETLTPSHIMKKKEDYEHEVPKNVRVLTMGVDTQNDRLEWEIVGWGVGHESWKIDRGIIYGDPAQQAVWTELENIIENNEYEHPHAKMKVYATGIDSGGGRTTHVYAFTNPRLHRRVYALKGASTIDAPEVTRRINRDVNHKHYGTTFFMVGVNRIKDLVWTGLEMESRGNWYIHFPRKPMYDKDYFSQIVAEYKTDKGRWEIRIKGGRNEAFDISVSNYAALRIAGVDLARLERDNKILTANVSRLKKKSGTRELSSGI
ncbi:MAG: phage terminase large subunit family protein [Candidatus Izemoplasmatales bacterium]|nr:phage terminase large subunit family protein [Candidatus Izemoplasmatales bacterium]